MKTCLHNLFTTPNQEMDSDKAARRVENAELKQQNEALGKRLENLEQMVNLITTKN